MEYTLDLRTGLVIWLVAITIIVIVQRIRPFSSVGLIYTYIVGLWLIHWPAALLYTLPWYWNEDIKIVEAGFTQSVYGIVAFAVGVLCVSWFQRLSTNTTQVLPSSELASSPAEPDRRLPIIYIIIGLLSSLVLSRLIGHLPTFNAIISMAGQLLVVGLALACWQSWKTGDSHGFTRWLLAAFLLPFMTIILQGFLGFGVFALISVLAFVASFVRFRPRVIFIGMLLAYVSLSFYIGYMRDRNEIRLVVWGGQSLEQRIARVYQTTTSLEWFNLQNREHLLLIDERLNQNVLAGSAVVYLSSGYQEYAHGATLWNAAIAIVPRIIWPDKPIVAGGNALVTAYTGIPFAVGTSVGIGQVMEFYINFGLVSVIAGFFVLGMLITVFDTRAARHLYRGDLQRFTFWFLPGLGFMAAGDSLMVMVANVAAGFVAALLVNRAISFWRSQHSNRLQPQSYPASYRKLPLK
jgi:hypothetical protein